MRFSIIVLALFLSNMLQAQLRNTIGSSDFSDWDGIAKVKGDVATIKNGEAISYRYANCDRDYPGMLRPYYGDATDWSGFSGLSLELFIPKEGTVDLFIEFEVDSLDFENYASVSTAKLKLIGKGWQEVYVPWELFKLDAGQRLATLYAIKKLRIKAESIKNTSFNIKNVTVTKGKSIVLSADIQGKSTSVNSSVTYTVELGNASKVNQGVELMFETMGWESMKASVQPESLEMSPGETINVEVTVVIPEHLPQGIRETQVLKAIPNGIGSEAVTIEFKTAVAVPTPNIIYTNDKWQQVRNKIENYQWAKEALAEYEKEAQNWEMKVQNTIKPGDDDVHKPIFRTHQAELAFNSAVTYQLTGKDEYAQKSLNMLRRLTDSEIGYLVTERGGSLSFVGEGGFFQDIARIYDMIRNSKIVTDKDHFDIEIILRHYVGRVIQGNSRGGISNWNVAEVVGAFYCTLALQDWHLADLILHSPAGVYDQIQQGIMSDGWWYECSVGYNLWVASEFSEVALALEPWGINIKDKKFPIGTTEHFSLMSNRRVAGLHGMAFFKWGAIEKNYISIKDMWDAVIPFLDYRSVLLAVNDAKEDKVSGQPFELAYMMYGDPEYAAVINRGNKRDLLYGVPELPIVTSEKMKHSTYADNMGIVQLRSQTKEREQKDQIQAALHYGSHGGHHGHFDRTGLVSMMRHGRSFYNPEMYWYGYSSHLYKFLVQTSISKNMVVVDQKMQEPKESFKTFFYTGDMLQATAVETKARWSYPPYGGMTYDNMSSNLFVKAWDEGRSLVVPENAPKYGVCTEFTEPVLQRRLMVMLDDYVVLADYLKAEEEHTFDWLMQIKGFKELSADKKEFVRHDNQMNPDPLGSGQFITDCDWYKTEGTARTKYEMCWGEGCDNAGARMPFSEDGPLKMDIFNAWPLQNEIMIATAPESFRAAKQVWYTITVDEQEIVNDSSGLYVLGNRTIDIDISGKKKLVLTTKASGRKWNNTVFWGDAKILLKDGSEIYVSSLPVRYDNVQQPKTKGLDYYDGPVKIAGELMQNSTPGNPDNIKKPGVVTIDLSGMDVVRFKAKFGGDFPMGDESSRRKTMAVRSQGIDARYLSVIEPYETESVIKSVTAKSANVLVVELFDGRVQKITITGLDDDKTDIKVSVQELIEGKVIREEQTK